MNQPSLQQLLPPRSSEAHKGNFGKVLVVGGDYGMAGAVHLCAEACARTGAGLTSIATRPEHILIAQTRPELLCYGIEHVQMLSALCQTHTVFALGPGLGKSDWSQSLAQHVLNHVKPMVVDADGLNYLTLHPQKQNHWILTPHPGEAARLLNTSTSMIQADRLSAALQLQKKFGGVIVLKGHRTLIVDEHHQPIQCPFGNPGMASAGMGDVLTGIISGLLAQGLIPIHAAQHGVFLHAKAGDLAAQQIGQRGLLALDLIPFLLTLMNEL